MDPRSACSLFLPVSETVLLHFSDDDSLEQ